MSFANRIPDYLARLERVLEQWLPAADKEPMRLHAAMRYASLSGGKRLRPLLIYATGEMLGVATTNLDAAAAAVELIHAYSLIHDDLPAMDNDDLRRGRPTCHRAFDEATAILAGDALQVLAFEILASDPFLVSDPQKCLEVITLIAKASGSAGMAGGQMQDLAAAGKTLTLQQLEKMHACKTGALISACVQLVTICAGPLPAGHQRRLEHYGRTIGLAFQIHDDILDVEGETSVIGKQQGADMVNNKPTFPSIMGLEASRKRAQLLCEEARQAVSDFGEAAEPLTWLARYVVTRNH